MAPTAVGVAGVRRIKGKSRWCEGIVLVTAIALCGKPAEISCLVTVITRQRPMLAVEIAAHLRVVELSGRKGPLIVAGSAARG